jgi:hypothetical protein
MSQTMSLSTQVVQKMAQLQGILLTSYFLLANTPWEIPDACVRVTFKLLEYSQGLVIGMADWGQYKNKTYPSKYLE